jgi:hypothetical protein
LENHDKLRRFCVHGNLRKWWANEWKQILILHNNSSHLKVLLQCYRKTNKVNLGFIVCFWLLWVPWRTHRQTTWSSFLVASLSVFKAPVDIHEQAQLSKCMILSLYGFTLTPFWHHLAFWFYSIFVGLGSSFPFLFFSFPFFSSLAFASVKCIAAMNFIYSLCGSLLPSCIENLWCENILKYEPFCYLLLIFFFAPPFFIFLGAKVCFCHRNFFSPCEWDKSQTFLPKMPF